MKPEFKHDCCDCELIGKITYPAHTDNKDHVKNADLYYCKDSILDDTIIARFSSEGYDYASMPVGLIRQSLSDETFSSNMPELIAGYYFAKAKGLVK